MQQHCQSQEVSYHLDDIVFAQKGNQEVWPAKVIKVLSEDSYQVKFYMLRRQTKVNRNQMWPFNAQICQRFVTEKSTAFYRKVVQMAKKYVQRKLKEENNVAQSENNTQQEQINKSFVLENVKFEIESSQIQIPFSQKRGLFIIEEVSSSFQVSQNENSCPQHAEHSSSSKKYINKGRHEVQLVALQKQKDGSSRRYQTRSQIRKKNRKAKKALIMVQKQEEIGQQSVEPKLQTDQNVQRILDFINAEIQQALIQETTDKFTQQENNQMEELQQNNEREEEEFDNNQQQTKQVLPQVQITQQQTQPQLNIQNQVFFGPIDFVDLSTQASLHSIHTMPAQQTGSTMASENDHTEQSFNNNIERQNQEHYQIENTLTQSKQYDSTSDSQSIDDISVKPSAQEVYNTILQSLLKLITHVEGHYDMLRPEEQLKLSRALDYFRQTPMDTQVIGKMVEFVNLFEHSKSKNKQKCYMEYMMIRSRLQILILLNKSQSKSTTETQLIQILQHYQSRKQSIK